MRRAAQVQLRSKFLQHGCQSKRQWILNKENPYDQFKKCMLAPTSYQHILQQHKKSELIDGATTCLENWSLGAMFEYASFLLVWRAIVPFSQSSDNTSSQAKESLRCNVSHTRNYQEPHCLKASPAQEPQNQHQEPQHFLKRPQSGHWKTGSQNTN